MNEIIKYRVWVKSLKKHKFVSCIDFLLDEIEVVEVVNVQHKAMRFSFDDVVIEQATGLLANKSHRGESEAARLIFEGDIVRVIGGHRPGFVGAVEYCPLEAMYHIKEEPLQAFVYDTATETPMNYLEIIGTIHDNTEN